MCALTPDPTDYPRLAAYVESLGPDLDAFATAQTRAFYSIELRKRLGPHLTEAPLASDLKSRLMQPYGPNDWIPASTYAALSCLSRDRLWTDDKAYHRGMYEIAAVMYGSIFFRAVMHILSPSLMVMGAAKRWGSFHKNTTLTVAEQSSHAAQFHLRYPAKLFPETCLKSLGATFDCAISGSGAKGFQYDLVCESDESARYNMRWLG